MVTLFVLDVVTPGVQIISLTIVALTRLSLVDVVPLFQLLVLDAVDVLAGCGVDDTQQGHNRPQDNESECQAVVKQTPSHARVTLAPSVGVGESEVN